MSRVRRLAVLGAGVTLLATLGLAPGSTASASRSGAPAQLVVGVGPNFGYTPDDLAIAYGFSPTTSRSKQVVAVVGWYDDPHIRGDLNTFDGQYGLPAETAKSLRVVNQTGAMSPLPSSTKGKGTSQQTATQVEIVRGVCNTCRILLVEAKSGSVANVAVAEKTAGRLGATEIVNALAKPEAKVSTSVLDAFTQPGVVITAPAGDRGWYGMDVAFDPTPPDKSPGRPSYPASDPHVVAVGGTTLFLDNTTAAIEDQPVWNADGQDGESGISNSRGQGATGGGCSTRYAAPAWQRAVKGYQATGCAGKRVVADVSVDGDPAFGGVDVYDSWGHSGWLTTGGDGMAAAIVGAMYALAGGAPGAVFPAAAVYENAARHPTAVYDVVEGGNGYCGGDTTSGCGAAVFKLLDSTTHNPNALGGGIVDCSFPRNDSDPATPPPLSRECNAFPGYDGPSGVGTPLSTGLFAPTNPAVAITHGVVHAGKAATFRFPVHPRLTHTTVKKLTVDWGDGHSTSGTSTHHHHTYAKAGRFHITVVVTDNLGQMTRVRTTVHVKKARHR